MSAWSLINTRALCYIPEACKDNMIFRIRSILLRITLLFGPTLHHFSQEHVKFASNNAMHSVSVGCHVCGFLGMDLDRET